jgi:predicted phage terminase large subunit-like protein
MPIKLPDSIHELNQKSPLSYQEKIYALRKAVSQASFFDFNSLLGHNDLNRVHFDLCSFLEAKSPFKLVLMPRYSFKSSVCTVGLSLYKLASNPNYRILIYSDASTKAQGFLTSIKNHIEGKVDNSSFGLLYDWASNGRETKWNESQIVIKGRTSHYPEPSVDTGGQETSKVGMHYDLIIFDDIVSDKNVTTKDQMDKTVECYQRALSLLKPGGEVLIVGTRWHFGDLYGRIIAENAEKQVFSIFVVDGVRDEKYGEYCFSDCGLSKTFLDEQRKNQGEYTFSCLYRQNPVDSDTAVFKTNLFSFYGDIKSDDLYITCACDPAGEGEDFTAITVVGTDNNLDMHILDIVNKHLQPSEIISEIIRLHYKYTFKMFGLEMNFYRGMLRLELDRRIDEERKINENFKLFGMHEFNATSRRGEGKHNRILGLQPYHERGALKFPGKRVELLEGDFSTLAFQMIQFPHSAHDDILDSLAYHLPLIRRGGVVKKNDIPYRSPAWFERKMWEEEIEKNNSLPKRFRRIIPEPSLS